MLVRELIFKLVFVVSKQSFLVAAYSSYLHFAAEEMKILKQIVFPDYEAPGTRQTRDTVSRLTGGLALLIR